MSVVPSPAAPVFITRGPIAQAARVAIYGPEGVGKSTLAAQLAAPVFLDTEGGTTHLDVARFPRPKSWANVILALAYLVNEPHGHQTLVIDSIDWLEKLLAEEVCRKASKESLEDFGYGKGFTHLAEEFSRFLAQLENLRDRGIHVVFVGHSTIRKFEAPDTAGSYDRYELKLSKHVAALTKEWVDALLFVNYHTKVTEKDGKHKAIGGRERVIYTTHTAAWDAKNRYGLDDKLTCAAAALAPIFAGAPSTATGSASANPATTPPLARPAAHSLPQSLHPSLPAPTGPILLITREQADTLERHWRTLNKTDDDRAKAFRWVGCDSIDLAWDELTADQAARILAKLQQQLDKLAAAPASPASDASTNGGAK